MNQPLAYVHPGAKIAKNVVIEPFATINNNVIIGEGTWVGSNVIIMEGARIGKNCSIFPGSVISAIPQDLKFNGEDSLVVINDNTTIRECVTINRGTSDRGETTIGKNCLIMAYCHVAHDCIIGDNCIFSNNSTLAGHVSVGNHAILAGFVIFPALFAFGIQPDSGPGLLFVTMASLFKEIPFGMYLGALFFFLVFIAAFTSIIGLLEAVVSTAMDSFKISRNKSVILCVSITFLLCITNVLGFNSWSHVTVFGKSIFGFFDFLSGSILLPLGGLLISIYVAHIWGFDNFMKETNQGAKNIRVTKIWGFVMKWVIPIIIFIILEEGLRGEVLS